MQQQLAASQKTAQDLKDDLTRLSDARGDNAQQITRLQKQLDESRKQAAVAQKQITELTDSRAEKEKALATVQQQLAASQKTAQDLKEQLTRLSGTQADNATQSAQLQKQLDESRKQADAAQKQITELTDNGTAKEKALADLQQQLADTVKKSDAVNRQWQEASKQLDAQAKQLAELKKSAAPAAMVITKPTNKDDLRDYALGAFWANEISNIIRSKEAYGYSIKQQQVLNGISDALNHTLKLSKDEIVNTLEALDKNTQSQEKNLSTEAIEQGKKFMAQFNKKAGVKRASMGYSYLISAKGTGKINDNDIVAITVRESLANGKVVNDMNKSGTVLALPLNQFPPLFKSAISQVNNQGEIRIVVPPELAYGKAGSLPKIPPDSTMIYDIKIVDVTKKN